MTEGDPIADGALASCIAEAGKLLEHTRQWLKSNHLELI